VTAGVAPDIEVPASDALPVGLAPAGRREVLQEARHARAELRHGPAGAVSADG
jgi:hypothetical protein